MINSLTMFWTYLHISFKGANKYRTNFWLGVLGICLSSFFQLFGAWVILNRIGSLNEWDLWQVSFMFGLWRIQYGVMFLLFGALWNLERLIEDGTLDRLLVRPRSILLQIPGTQFNIAGIGQIGFGVLAAVIGFSQSPPLWSWWTVPWIAILLISGTVIQLSIVMIANASNFMFVKVNAALRTVDRASWQINLFPLSAYSVALQVVLTFLLPWAFLVFYPAHLLAGRVEEVFIHSAFAYAAPLVATGFATIAFLSWKAGLGRYQGIGGI